MKIIIFGCGQGGQTLGNLLSASVHLLAFADNNPQTWGKEYEGIPVISPAQIPQMDPDLVWIAIKNPAAASSVLSQLQDLGYTGPVQNLSALLDQIDFRLATIRLLAKEIRQRCLPGEIAELGVHQGASARELNRLFPERKLYLFDTFQGFPEKALAAEAERNPSVRWKDAFQDTSVSQVLEQLPYPEQAVICAGYFPDSLPSAPPRFAFVHLDPDLYESVAQGLRIFWPLLVCGGVIFVHDYRSLQFPGAGQAVKEFCREHRLTPLPLPDLHGSALLVKQPEDS